MPLNMQAEVAFSVNQDTNYGSEVSCATSEMYALYAAFTLLINPTTWWHNLICSHTQSRWETCKNKMALECCKMNERNSGEYRLLVLYQSHQIFWAYLEKQILQCRPKQHKISKYYAFVLPIDKRDMIIATGHHSCSKLPSNFSERTNIHR